jgi:hypothetical protein
VAWDVGWSRPTGGKLGNRVSVRRTRPGQLPLKQLDLSDSVLQILGQGVNAKEPVQNTSRAQRVTVYY